LSPEEEAEYHEGFKLFDKKNQNSIDKADLGTVMRSLGMSVFTHCNELLICKD
jgi:Ca2+-binding EF-hand superfamily protein